MVRVEGVTVLLGVSCFILLAHFSLRVIVLIKHRGDDERPGEMMMMSGTGEEEDNMPRLLRRTRRSTLDND